MNTEWFGEQQKFRERLVSVHYVASTWGSSRHFGLANAEG